MRKHFLKTFKNNLLDKTLEYEKPNLNAIEKVEILFNQTYVCWKLCITIIKISNVWVLLG